MCCCKLLKTLYHSQTVTFWMRWLLLIRDIGLVAVDKVKPAKDVFIKHAMGLTDDLPELAKRK